MKLFERSVDLAQFSEDTPLYPICRAWIRNQPHNRRLGPRERSPTPRPDNSFDEDDVIILVLLICTHVSLTYFNYNLSLNGFILMYCIIIFYFLLVIQEGELGGIYELPPPTEIKSEFGEYSYDMRIPSPYISADMDVKNVCLSLIIGFKWNMKIKFYFKFILSTDLVGVVPNFICN